MNLFLKAKHWQLFLLMVTPYVVSSVVMVYQYMILLTQSVQSSHETVPDFGGLFQTSMWMIACSMLSFFIFILWLWAANVNLRKKLPIHLRDSLVRFYISFCFPILYILFMPFGYYFLFSDVINGSVSFVDWMSNPVLIEDMIQKGKILLPISLGLYILYIPAVLYLAYRTGKTMKKLECKREVGFSECIVEMILTFFYPIVGVWFLQPQVNKYAEYPDGDESQTPPPTPLV